MTDNGPFYDQPHRTFAIICSDARRASALAEFALTCRLQRAAPDMAADIILVDNCSDPDRMQLDWFEIAAYLNHSGVEALVWVGVDQLDAAFAALPAERCHFLVVANDLLAVPVLAMANGRATMDQLHDHSRDNEFGALNKISDDLADFARTLARLAEQEGTLPNAVNDKPVSFRPAPANIFAPLAASAEPVKTPTAQAMREMIKLRRMREQYFPADLFADPGWDILLDLFAASLEGKSVSVSSLCIAAAVPPTTALRWITLMTQQGVLVRRQDPNDARRVFIEMSADTANSLASYFQDAATRLGAPLRSPI